MKLEEKLKAIIEKAQKNGWKGVYPFGNTEQVIPFVIFSHDFAKAFWSEPTHTAGIDGTVNSGWQYHIQQLALTSPDERIDYLYKFV